MTSPLVAGMKCTPEELKRVEDAAKKATAGPYFAAEDYANDLPVHARSGLALVDTGRKGDWPIARLVEWQQARYIALSNPDFILRLLSDVRTLQERLTEAGRLLKGFIYRYQMEHESKAPILAPSVLQDALKFIGHQSRQDSTKGEPTK